MEKLHHFLKFMRTDTNIELISISLGKNQKIIWLIIRMCGVKN